ncbi:MAG: hypothetical protein ACRCZF_03325, partial [Gemmataceae bacterium]
MPTETSGRMVALVTLALFFVQLARPVVVDDAAYLAFARQIAEHPTDPYGFELYWYDAPQPAMEILAPPVFLYSLAAAYKLGGGTLWVLKLALLPWLFLFTRSVDRLLRHLAPEASPTWLWLYLLGPAVLPLWNLMLDMPALTLGLVVIERSFRQTQSLRFQLYSGVILGLALQTKYAAASTVLVLLVLTWQNARWRQFCTILGTGMAVFASWECALYWNYGESHFWGQWARGGPTVGQRFQILERLIPYLGFLCGSLVLLQPQRHLRNLGAALWVVLFLGLW